MPNLYTSQTPALTNVNEGVNVTLGQGFYVTAAGSCTGGRFYASTTVGGTYELVLFQVTADDNPVETGTGTVLATVTFGALTPGTWNSVSFSSPVALSTGVAYVLAVRTSQGRYTATGGFFNSGGLTNGNIVAWQTGTNPAAVGIGNLDNGKFIEGIVNYPNKTFNGNAYFIDPTITFGGVPFTRDYASTWRVFNAFTRDYASSWRVLNAFTRDYSGSWRIFNAITRDYVSTWRVLNAFTKDYSSVWRVLNAWTTDYTTTWRVLNAIARDYSDTWRVFNSFARDYTSMWDVLSGTAFVRDYASTWRVFNTFSADYSSSWRVFGPFARDYTDNWRVFNSLTRDYASTWRVFRAFTRDYTSTWAVFGETPDGLVVQVWSGNAIITVASVTIWNGAQEISATIESVTG